MLVLAIDTATARTSVALQGDFGVATRESARSAGESAVWLIDELFTETRSLRRDLSTVVVGVGPGPYTSTRVGVMIARTISMALSIPAVGICTLDAIAAEVVAGNGLNAFGVATDARRKEIYYATYGPSGERVSGPAAAKPADLDALADTRSWAGDGFDRFPDLVDSSGLELLEPRFPLASVMATLALEAQRRGEVPLLANPMLSEHSSDGSGAIPVGTTLLAPYPIYLRRPDAREPVAVTGA